MWPFDRARRAPPVLPLAPPTPGTGLDEVLATGPLLQRILVDNIIRFWYPAAVDVDHGGYLANHDEAGRWLGPSPKHIVVQARVLWFFSRLARAGYGDQYLEAARSGFEFLVRAMWNREAGGFHWSVSHDGARPEVTEQHVYGQAFGLFAVAEYALATGDPAARAFAGEIWSLIERRFHDREFGGYFTRLPVPSPEQDAVRTVKSFNDHIHLLESLESLWRITPSESLRTRILELMLILTGSVRHPGADGARERHQRDWTPSDPAGRLRVSYGHDLEAGWLLLATADTLGLPPAPLVHQARSAMRVMLDHGRDPRGGVCNSGPLRGRADDRQKIWWVQAEGLVACLDWYAHSGDEAARRAYLAQLDWIATRQVDWVHGEWHHTIHPSGRVSGGKAGPWKEPYHAGRAMLECLERLGRLGVPTRHGPIRR